MFCFAGSGPLPFVHDLLTNSRIGGLLRIATSQRGVAFKPFDAPLSDVSCS